ncbi:Protein of unknown function [Pyronema omphalodes CBS 100304]|uniref:Uncharacterized protein n=1 Tax=Pyronema omphalodes (strain CBS 100304) TaxID=1076935 RepID=U4L638_PYROM|nr:Protein of unknown function [Pyronema omphalodes CBS 100304]
MTQGNTSCSYHSSPPEVGRCSGRFPEPPLKPRQEPIRQFDESPSFYSP